MDVSLIVESLDPKLGGIPRYNYELSKLKIYKSIINFSDYIENKTILQKIINKTYKRANILKQNKEKLGTLLHFTQPEIFGNLEGMDKHRIILTVHDLAVFGRMKKNNLYTKIRNSLFRKQFKKAIERADLILTNSTQTSNELMETLGVDKEKIITLNHGISSKLKPLKVKTGNIIGYFGGFNVRKRVDKALEEFTKSNLYDRYKFYVYGNPNGEFNRIKGRFSKYENIEFRGPVKEGDMSKVLNSFKYFIFPTSYEGLGLPILEGIACGVPTFIYRDAVVPDEVKRYPIIIDKIEDIEKFDYKKLKQEFLSKSKLVKRQFSWDRHRRELIKIYDKILS